MKSYNVDEKPDWIKHVIPYLTAITVLGYIYPYVDNISLWSSWILKAIYFQWLIYIVLSVKYIMPIIRKIREKESLKRLDVWLLSIYMGVTVTWLAYSTAAYTSYIVGALSFTFVLYLIVLLLIFRNGKEVSFFQEKERYKNKEMDQETQNLIGQKLSIIIEKELFLNPNFSLEEAAKELKLSKHLLS
ncbi:MAG: hypothetical protein EOO93_07350, partial [Pedobacter sp.]